MGSLIYTKLLLSHGSYPGAQPSAPSPSILTGRDVTYDFNTVYMLGTLQFVSSK